VTLSATPVADTNASDWTPTLDTAFSPAVNKEVKGSDVLVFRSSVARGVPSYVNADVANGSNSFAVTQANTLQSGALAVISDCAKSIAFQISSVAGTSPANVTVAGATGAPGNTSAALPFGFARGALVSALTTVVYYVGLGADGYPALKRLEILNGQVNGAQIFTDEEIAPSVENMQVLYGVDTNGAKAASAYVTADQVTSWDSIVGVRVAVLSASPAGAVPKPAAAPTFNLLGTTVNAPIDTRMRKVFDITITMRNAVE
jgi:type IV pilus assembly protein PilW